MRIKGFDKNLCCREMQFEIGKEYKIENEGKELKLCSDTVFHYCDSLQKVHRHYSCDDETNRFCEIEVLGEEITDGEKCGSNHIRILREIVGEELKELKGIINGNTGIFNTGYMNSGYMNSGDMNSGDMNSGNMNSGYMNSGDRNSGNRNSGDMNSGDMNSGDMNSGYMNSGDRNSGYMNSGYMNSGYMNSGNMNSGNMNSGDMNSGNMNSGYMNSGNMNSGIFNSCNNSNGVFCNKEDMNIRIFNMPSGMSMNDFYRSKYWNAMCSVDFTLTEWVEYTEEEKTADKKKAMIGDYLKTNTYKEACAKWWADMSEENREIIKSMPNFDNDVFKDITGIEV